MLFAFARALGQLDDPALRRPILWSLLIAGLVFAGLWTGIGALLAHTSLFANPWLDGAVDALGAAATLALTWVLYPGVTAAALSLFLDRVVAAVERRHYPHLPPPRPVPLAEQLGGAARFLALFVGLNLAALPLYLVPVVNVVVFTLLNGYLLGREYFDMAALRRLGPVESRALRRRARWRVFATGAMLAMASAAPLVNLAVPVVAAATMTHLVERWRRNGPPGQ